MALTEPLDESVTEKAKFRSRYNKAKGLIGSTVSTPIDSELRKLPSITTTRVKVEAKDSQAAETKDYQREQNPHEKWEFLSGLKACLLWVH